LAKSLGTERTPLSGGNSKITRSDSLEEKLFIEAKHRKKLWVWSLWEGTKGQAKAEDKIPVLGLHQANKKGWLIVVHSDDLDSFIQRYNEIQEGMEND
jgi:hypothetical protein